MLSLLLEGMKYMFQLGLYRIKGPLYELCTSFACVSFTVRILQFFFKQKLITCKSNLQNLHFDCLNQGCSLCQSQRYCG